jgi:hypothetical protein
MEQHDCLQMVLNVILYFGFLLQFLLKWDINDILCTKTAFVYEVYILYFVNETDGYGCFVCVDVRWP